MESGTGQVGDLEADTLSKDRWAQALVNKMTAVTVAFRGAGDQRHAARRTYLQLAPEARTESYLEVIDEVLYQSTALSRLTRNARMAVARRAHVVEFMPGEALCVRGTPQDALLVVMSGEVEVVEGHWDSAAAPPPPSEPGRFSYDRTGFHANLYQPPPPSQYAVRALSPQQQTLSQHTSRRHLNEQLSISSAASQASGAVNYPQPPATPLPLQLDSRHTIHPALQSHPSAQRRFLHNHFRPHGKASTRGGAARSGPAGSGDGGNHISNGMASRVVLHRGDSLGAVDMGWLSRLPRSLAAAALEEVPAAPSITSRALLATRAEMVSGGGLSGQAPAAAWSSGGITGSMLRSLAGGTGPRRSSQTGATCGEEEVGCGEGNGEREEGTSGGSKGGMGGAASLTAGNGGGLSTNSYDPLQRLRWPCTAVAVGGRVECAAIGLQQLCAALATEMHWDVEAMVESLEELPVFAALSGTELRQLVRVLKLNTYSGGTVIYKQGSMGNDLYIIRSGCVRLLKQVALDDNTRNRLNRISAELSAVRDQTAAAAALLHGQQGASAAPFGSSSGFSPVAGPGGTLSGRGSTANSLSGSVSTPASPGRTRRLSHSQGGCVTGGLGVSPSGGWYGPAGRFSNGPPGSPRGDGLQMSLSAAAAIQSIMGRGPSPFPASAPVLTLRDRTPNRQGRTPSGGSSSNGQGASASHQHPHQQPSPPGSRPVSGSGPVAPGTARLLPECNGRAHSSGYKDQSRTGQGLADATLRRHSTSAPVQSSPVGQVPAAPQTPSQYPQPRNTAHGGSGGGNGGYSSRRHRCRRRTSHITADELLDRFGVVPRALGERTEALYEDVVMPGTMGEHSAVPAVQDSEVQYPSSDSEEGSCTAPGSPVGLPPVAGSRPPSLNQIPGGWVSAAAGSSSAGSATAAVPAALPVWQARVPRQLGFGQEMVFVELGVLTAGQCFGEVRSDGVAMRTSSAVCDTRTEVLAISRNELHQRLGGRVFDYLWNQVPNEGPQSNVDPAMEAGQCAQQLERSMHWTLFKQKLVADVLTQKEQRRRTALKCR